MLATDKQINYLCVLAKKVEKIKAINSKRNVITASLPEYIDWQRERHLGVTVQDVSLRISAYKNIICMSMPHSFCVECHKFSKQTLII